MASPIVVRAVPFAIFIAFIALSQLAPSFVRQDLMWDARWLNVIRAVVVATALTCFWRGYVELHALGGASARWWLLAVSSGLAVFAAWICFDDGWAVFGRTKGFDPTGGDGTINVMLAGLRLAEMALVVPVMEELFWRSFLLRWLDTRKFLAADPRRASSRAFVVTAVLFASEHSLWFAGLIAGLAYNWLYIRSGNLWVPIASHAVTNATLGIWILATRSWHLW